jgi:hypothetical protein
MEYGREGGWVGLGGGGGSSSDFDEMTCQTVIPYGRQWGIIFERNAALLSCAKDAELYDRVEGCSICLATGPVSTKILSLHPRISEPLYPSIMRIL